MILYDETLESPPALTQKELCILRQTTRVAAIAITYLSHVDAEDQEAILQLLQLLLDQITSIIIEKGMDRNVSNNLGFMGVG